MNIPKKSRSFALVVAHIHAIGGIEAKGCDIANHLVEQGHRVMVLSKKGPQPHNATMLPLHPQVVHQPFHLDHPKATQTLLQQFEAECCAILYNWKEALHWLEVLKGSGIPLLYSERNNPLIIERLGWNRRDRQLLLAAADTIHLLTPQYLFSVPELYRSKAHYIPNYARPLSSPIEKSRQAEKVLLSLGRFDPVQKQLPLMIEAFAQVADSFPHWRLELWGDGPDKTLLQKIISHYRLEKRVLLKGQTHQPEIPYQRSDLFLISSLFEGFPNTVVEAMSFGLPVVGYADCSGVNFIVQHGVNGRLAPEMSASALAAELRLLMNDDSLRSEMSLRARERAKEFDRLQVLQQWEEMLIECADQLNQTALQQGIDSLGNSDHPAAHHLQLWKIASSSKMNRERRFSKFKERSELLLQKWRLLGAKLRWITPAPLLFWVWKFRRRRAK